MWQYLWSLLRQSSPLRPPKGADPGPRQLFPCKTAVSGDHAKGPSSTFRSQASPAHLARYDESLRGQAVSSVSRLQETVLSHNLTPRKCLGFLTPLQALLKELGRDVQIRFA